MNLLTTAKDSGGSSFLMLILMGIMLYFIPTIIAILKKKPNKLAISALNFFLGWSIIGWVVALVWSLSNNSSNQSIIITQPAVPANSDKFGELEKLNNLLEKGVISQE